MKKITGTSHGFTLIEILIALGILVLLLTIGGSVLINLRKVRQLETITDSIAAKLEEARTNAMSGKNGQNYGITFASTSYTSWYGTSYSSSDPNNVVLPINSNFVINTTLSGYTVRFDRITGAANTTGTTTITSTNDASTTDTILIGPSGDITVIK